MWGKTTLSLSHFQKKFSNNLRRRRKSCTSDSWIPSLVSLPPFKDESTLPFSINTAALLWSGPPSRVALRSISCPVCLHWGSNSTVEMVLIGMLKAGYVSFITGGGKVGLRTPALRKEGVHPFSHASFLPIPASNFLLLYLQQMQICYLL